MRPKLWKENSHQAPIDIPHPQLVSHAVWTLKRPGLVDKRPGSLVDVPRASLISSLRITARSLRSDLSITS